MENYNEIMAKVEETELGVKELRKLVEALIAENTMLREQLSMSVNKVNDNLSLEEAFKAFYLTDSYPDGIRKKTRAYNGFARAGYKTIGQFKGISLNDLCSTRNCGVCSCAIMVVLLEHFGVQVMQLNSEHGCTAHSKKVLEEIPKVKDGIVFTK